jgi:hypothetical protein
MDDQQRIEAENEDVDAHRRHKLMASEDAESEETEEDDVEAHMLRHRPESM